MTTSGAGYLLPLFERVADTILEAVPSDQVVVARFEVEEAEAATAVAIAAVPADPFVRTRAGVEPVPCEIVAPLIEQVRRGGAATTGTTGSGAGDGGAAAAAPPDGGCHVAVLPVRIRGALVAAVAVVGSSGRGPYTGPELRLLRAVVAQAETGLEVAAPVSRRTWSFLENLFANAPEAVIFADKNHRILRVNAEFVRMFGYSAAEAEGRVIDDLIAPADRIDEAQSLSRNVENGGFVRQETRRCDKHGQELEVSILGGPIDEDGEIVGIFAIYRDISGRKRVEAAVEASLREKEVLLQEIHHRVKNNMQIISSILSLEIGNLSDPEVALALQASQNRIRSMALVHEKLYQSSDLARVDIAEYVSDLCSDLESLSAESSDLTLELDTDELHTGVDFAIPFGLIVNELVTNAIKHARPRSGRPVVKVRMRVTADRTELVVSDNGPGLPPELDGTRGSSLGLKLVQSLTAQLGGRLDFESADGAVMRVSLAPPSGG